MKQAAAQEKTTGGQGVEDQAGRSGYDELDWRSIERITPIVTVAYANDSLETFVRDAKILLRSIFTTIRSLFNNLRNFKAPVANGEVLHDLFRYGVLSLRIYEGGRDAREEKDALELLSGILLAYDSHTFTEVWTYSLEFYCQQVLDYPHIVTLLQSMLSNVEVSHQTVAILLKHLMDNLENVGSQTKAEASLSLRLFKCAFMAVNSYIDVNEQVLVPHLAKLIINCFSYAAKAEDPSPYYQILRALFR
jgi:transformation/transcription domain-associated protein